MQTIGFIMRLHFFSQSLSAVWHYGKEVFAGIVTHEMMQLRSEWHVHLIYKETHGSGMLEILKVLVFFISVQRRDPLHLGMVEQSSDSLL